MEPPVRFQSQRKGKHALRNDDRRYLIERISFCTLIHCIEVDMAMLEPSLLIVLDVGHDEAGDFDLMDGPGSECG